MELCLRFEVVEWAWPYEPETMFHVVNSHTRAAQMEGLAAESSFRLSRVGGNILGMLNWEMGVVFWGMKYGPVGLEGTPGQVLF